jgi:hypothetical protein
MTSRIELPLHSISDLPALDARLRVLCNTTAGVQCQNVLTTEYQAWRLKVGQMLHKDHDAAPPTASVLAAEGPQAFLHGFRLQFSPPTCVIVPCAPSLASATGLRKRKAVKISDVLESCDI